MLEDQRKGAIINGPLLIITPAELQVHGGDPLGSLEARIVNRSTTSSGLG